MGEKYPATLIEVAIKQFTVAEKENYMLLSDGLMTQIQIFGNYYLGGANDHDRAQRYDKLVAALKSSDHIVYSDAGSHQEASGGNAGQFVILHQRLLDQMRGFLRYYCLAKIENSRQDIFNRIAKALGTAAAAIFGEEDCGCATCPEGSCCSKGFCGQCQPNAGG